MRSTIVSRKQRKRQSGFSLTEMALGFLAIAAIAAVVMGGANLVENARYSGVFGNVVNFTQAIEQFYRKYRALPGDMADVSELPGATAGNGNSVIDPAETRLFWQHLQLAGLLEGSYSGGASNVPGVDVPVGPFDKTGYSIVANEDGEIIIRLSRFSNSSDSLGVFTPEDAETIDAKSDDGKPLTAASRVRAVNGDGAADANVCFTGVGEDAVYNVNNDNAICLLDFVLNPYIAPADTEETPPCPRLGATRVSADRSCPLGYPGKVIETCRPDPQGWTVTDITCEAAKCTGEREYVYKDTRVESCPDNYTGAVLRECSATGQWIDAADQGSYVCQEDVSACTVEGQGRILPCGQGYTGSVQQSCTGGSWATDSDTCTAIACAGPAAALGETRTSTDIIGSTTACDAVNYRCRQADGTACLATDGIIKACSMTGAATGEWEIVSNTCVPVDYAARLGASCVAGTEVSMGCPAGEVGQNNFRCVEINESGDTDWEPLGVNTCRPKACGDYAVGSIRESRQFTCPDGMAGNVYEVCNICESGEDCYNVQNSGGDYINRDAAIWEVNYSNCAPQCDGSADNDGYAYWPNADAGTTGVRSASCIDGYYGVAVRNCTSVAATSNVQAHGAWSSPSKSCFLPPFSLTGLAFWVDANNDASIVTVEGGTLSNDDHVSIWYDMSSNGVNMSDTDAANNANRPLYKTSGINGKPSLYFDGSDQLGAANASSLAFERTDDFTTIAVMQNAGEASWGYLQKQDNAYGWAIGKLGGAQVLITNGTPEIRTNLSRTPTRNIPYIQAVKYDGSSVAAGLNIYHNGYAAAEVIETDTLSGVLPQTVFRLAARNDGGNPTTSSNYIGHMGEILVYETALSDTKRRQVEEYLSNKWDVPIAPKFEDMEGMTLWLDAMDADGDSDSETNPSSSLATWYDKGPFRNHATQSNSTERPTWQSTGLNGRASILFDGSNDHLSMAGTVLDTGNNPYSLAMVFQTSAAGNTHNDHLGVFSNSTSSAYQSISIQVDNVGIFRHYWINSGLVTKAATIKPDVPYIVTTYYDNAVGPRQGRRAYINGDELAYSSHTTLNAAHTEWVVGTNYGNRYFQGSINELLAFNRAITDDERQSIEQYLAGKWGIALEWTPKDISGLKFWWDGDQEGALHTGYHREALGSGTGFSTTGYGWNDKSGNGYHGTVTNSNTTYHPSVGAIGALNAAYFNNTHSRMNQVHPDIEAAAQEAHSYFIVAKPTDNTAGYLTGFDTCNNATSCYSSLLYIGGEERINVNDEGGLIQLDSESYRDRAFMASVIANPLETKFYIDGKLKRTSRDAFKTAANGGLRMAFRTDSTNYYKGYVGEFLFYERELGDAERELIEAYLGNKWPLGESWAPTQIPGLELWLDADDSNALELTNGYVAKWKNKAFENSALTHMTGGDGITLTQNAKNGRAVLNFDGTSTARMISNAELTARTAIVVHNSPSNSRLMQLIGGGMGQHNYVISQSSKDALNGVFNHHPHYIDGKLEYANTRPLRVFKGVYTITTFVIENPSNASSPLHLRQADPDGSNLGQGTGPVAELLIWNRNITTAERLQAEEYLSAKWGIPVVRPNLNSPAYGLQGLALWLDAADGNTVATPRDVAPSIDEGPAAWANKGNVVYNPNVEGLNNNGAFSAIQKTFARQPTYQANGINGTMPSMRFDGGDTYTVPNFSMSPVMTGFVAAKFNTTANEGTLFIEHNTDTNSLDGAFIWGGTTGIRVRRSGSSFAPGGSGAWLGTTLQVATVYNDGTTAGFYKNNTLPTSQTAIHTAGASGVPNNLVSSTLFIGSRNQASYFSNGDYGELLIYDRYLPANERKIVEDYLVNKWINGISPDNVVGTIGSSRDITVWLDASDTTHMTMSSGNNIQQVNDDKGATPLYHAVQSNVSANPLYVANVQNGNGVMRFDGVDDVLWLENNDTSDPLMLKEVISSAASDEDEDFTIMTVLSPSLATENDGFPTLNQMAYGAASAEGNVGLSIRADVPRLVGFTLTDGQPNQAIKEVSLGAFYVTALYQGSGYLYFDVNGENISKLPAEPLRAGLDTPLFMIGGGNSDKPFKGDIGEFIAFGKMLQQNEREQIEEYLGGKWGVAVVTGADGASSFTDPTSIGGLTLWLDADDASTLNGGGSIGEGTVITSWADKSDNNLDMTSAYSPTYKLNVLNNKPIIESTGNGAHFYSDIVSSSRFASNNQVSIFQVYRAASGDSSVGRKNIVWESASSNRVLTHIPHNNGNSYFDFGNNSSGGRIYRTNISALQYDNWVVNSILRYPSNDAIIYVNGELFHFATMTDLLNNSGTDRLRVFTNNTSAAYKDQLAELLFYNVALSDIDRQNVENYLMSKWGIGEGVGNDIAYSGPSDVAGLLLWLDADDETTLYANGDCSSNQSPASGSNIACWRDKALGNGAQNVINTSPNNRPQYYADKKALYFDGTSDFLTGAAAISAGDDTHTMFAVWETHKVGTQVIWEQNHSSVVTGRRAAFLLHSTGSYGFNGQNNDAHALVPYSSELFEKHVTAMVMNNGAIKISHNGVVYNGSVNAGTANIGTYATFIGQKVNNAERLMGNIHEILVYDNALNDNDRTKIEAYLSNKWHVAEVSGNGPAAIAKGLTLWLDASDASTINAGSPASNDAVTSWTNKVPNINIPNVTGNGVGRTYITTGQNGLAVVRGNTSTSGQLTRSVLRSALLESNQGSMFITQNVNTGTASNSVFWSDSSNRRFSVHMPFSDGVNYFDFGACCGANGRVSSAGPSNQFGEWHVMSIIKRSDNYAGVYMDGDLLMDSRVISNTLSNTTGTLYITGNAYNGDMGEILVYRYGLDDAERLEVEDYLMEKWVNPVSSDSDALSLWFDAADAGSINAGNPIDGDEITVWTNKADNTNIPSLTNGSNGGPTFKTNMLGGKPAFNFDSGIRHYLTRSNVQLGHFASTNEVSIFMVQQAIDDGSFNNMTSFFWQYSADRYRINMHAPEGGNLKFDFGELFGPNSNRMSIANPSGFMGSWHTLSAIKRADLTGSYYIDGEQVKAQTMDDTLSDGIATPLYVGRSDNAGTYHFNGNLAELLVYRSALSEGARLEVESYLQEKWFPGDVGSAKMVQAANLALWLDAADYDTLYGSNDCSTDPRSGGFDTVGCWQDKSGNNRHALQSNSAVRPNMAEDVATGLNMLNFNHAQTDRLELGSNYIYSSTDGLTIFTVARPDNFNSEGAYLYHFGFNGNRHYALHLRLTSAGGIYAVVDGPADHGGVTVAYSDREVDGLLQVTGEYRFGHSQALYINGSMKASAAATGLAGLTATQVAAYSTRQGSGGPVTIGAQSKTYNEALRDYGGQIGELLVYTNVSLSTAERRAVENYLMNKWGITPDDELTITNAQTPESLVLWLDASDSDTINGGDAISDFSAITEWRDKSDTAGRAIRFRTSGDSGVRYRTSSMNGLPSMAFDSIPLRVSGTDGLDLSNHGTWFVVTASDADSAKQHGVLLSKGNTETNFRLSWDSTSSKGLRFCSGANAATCANAGNGYTDLNADTPMVLTYRYKSGSPGTVDFYRRSAIGSSSVTGVSAANSLAAATGSNYVMIGAQAIDDAGAYTQGYRGDISELLMYNYYMEEGERKGVENYLMSKWNMVDIPTSISGITLWLDASDDSTVNYGIPVDSGDFVNIWHDKSGNRIRMKADAGKRVLYGDSPSTRLNGKPVMALKTGTTTGLAFESVDSHFYSKFVGNNEMTAFGVMRNDGTSSSLYWWQNGPRFNLHTLTTLTYDFGTCCTAGTGRYTTPSIPDMRNNWWIVMTARDAETNKVFVELDSNARSLVYQSTLSSTFNTTGTDKLEIGSHNGGTANMDGYIAEVLMYRRNLTQQEKTTIRRYLGAKWGIAVR